MRNAGIVGVEFDTQRVLETIKQICSVSTFLKPNARPIFGRRLRKYLERGRDRLEVLLNGFRDLDYAIMLHEFRYHGEWATNALVSRAKNSTGGILLVGHHDYCAGLGAEDNASALAVMLEIGRCLTNENNEISFASFDLEEQGIVGSRRFVARLDNQQLKKFRAVIALECLGSGKDMLIYKAVCGAESDPSLVSELYAAAEKCGHKPIVEHLGWVQSDHVAFAERGIKTMEVGSIDFQEYLQFVQHHSARDKRRIFNAAHTVRDLPENILAEPITAIGESLLQFLLLHDQRNP